MGVCACGCACVGVGVHVLVWSEASNSCYDTKVEKTLKFFEKKEDKEFGKKQNGNLSLVAL